MGIVYNVDVAAPWNLKKNRMPIVIPTKAEIQRPHTQTTEVFWIPVFFLTRASSRKNRNDRVYGCL